MLGVNNIPLLRKGAFGRVIRPGDPRMQTAQIMYPTPTPYTLHPTPCTLHPAPYTLGRVWVGG